MSAARPVMPGPRAASPRAARPASPRLLRAPSTPKAKAMATAAPGSKASVPSKKKPPTAKKVAKAGASTPKAKKTLVHHTPDGDLVVEEEQQPTGAGEGEIENEDEEQRTPRAGESRALTTLKFDKQEEEDGIAPDAAAFLAEALASFRPPASHRASMTPCKPSTTLKAPEPVYQELYQVTAHSLTSARGADDEGQMVDLSPSPPAVASGSVRHLLLPPPPPPPPPISICAPPPPTGVHPPPPPGRDGDSAAPTMLAAALSQINSGLESHRLRHVEAQRDRSQPLLEPGVGVKMSVAPKLFAELSGGLESHRLRHVENVNDRSAPLIESEVKLRPSSHGSLVNEIKEKRGFIDSFIHRRSRAQASQETLSAIASNPANRLRRAEAVNDRSTPLIEAGLSVRKSAAPQLFAQLKAAKGPTMLRHVENVNDRSAPYIEKVQIKRNAAPQLFDELKRRVSSFFGGASSQGSQDM